MHSGTIIFLWPLHVKYNILTRLTVQRIEGFGLLQSVKANFGTVGITEGEKCNDPTVNVNCRLQVVDRRKCIFAAMEEIPKATSITSPEQTSKFC